MSARIGLILCSADFAHAATQAAELLDKFGIELTTTVANALWRPDAAADWIRENCAAGMKVLIVVDDGRANLPHCAAANAAIPILAVATGHGRQESLPMPAGVALLPSATDAAMFAVEILALERPQLAQRIADHRVKQSDDVAAESEWVKSEMKRRRSTPADPIQPPKVTPRMTEKDEAWLRQAEAEFKPRLPERKSGSTAPAGGATPREKRIEYSIQLREVITASHEIARAYRHEAVAPVHFIAAIMDTQNSAARAVLERINADFERIAEHLTAAFPPSLDEAPTYFSMDPTAHEVLQHAKQIARDLNRHCLTTLDVLESVIKGGDSPAGQALLNSGIPIADIHAAIRDHREPNECVLLEQSQGRPREPEKPVEIDPARLAEMQQRLSGALQGNQQPLSPVDAVPDEETSAGESLVPAKPRLIECDPDNPSVDHIEEVADTLLEGKIVGFPTDTGYVFGVDATNARAVARLRELSGRPESRPITVLINSRTVLKNLVKTPTEELEMLFDRLWPGPLTILFEKHPERFKAVSADNTIGVRMPDHYAILGILSMVGRPVAAVPFPGAQYGEKPTISNIERFAGSDVSLLLVCAGIPARKQTAILNVSTTPPTVLRHGEIPPDKLTGFLK